jgi:hypothetical protein
MEHAAVEATIRKRRLAVLSHVLLLAGAAACSSSGATDLSTALKGIDEAKFLLCSGPPSLEFPEGGQDRRAFVTKVLLQKSRRAMVGPWQL